MAFKLTKQEIKQRNELVDELEAEKNKLDDAVRVFNEALEKARNELLIVLTDYNATVEDARNFVADIVSQAENDVGEKSERWQESERGQAVGEWVEAWRNVERELSEVELELPEDIEPDMPEHDTQLGDAPEEAQT